MSDESPRRLSSGLRRLSGSRRGDAPSIGAGSLASILPDNYAASTTEVERVAHFELFKKYQSDEHEGAVSVTWSPQTMRDGTPCVSLHMCFSDIIGSLNAITSTLTELGVSVYRVSAFCTDTGIALDSFELSHFDQTSADVIVKRLQMLESNTSRTRTSRVLFTGIDELARHMPADYSTSTTAANRLKHLELYRQLNEDGDNGERVVISWELKPDGDDSHNVLIHLAFRDCLGSLSAISSTLAERGINLIKVSAFSTDTGVAIDMLEVNTFDLGSAAALKARLQSLISVQEGEDEAPTEWPGGSAIAFRATWRGTMGGKRGHTGEVAIGPDWFAIGQTTLGAGDLAFLKEDFKDGATLHLGFVHKRRNHSIAITFPGGAAHQERALTLLARFRPMAKSASTTNLDAYTGAIADDLRNPLEQRGPMLAPPLATPLERTSVRLLCARCARLAIRPFELDGIEAARTRIGRRYACLLILTAFMTILAAAWHIRSSTDWRLFRTAFHPATCTVLNFDLRSDVRFSERQECKFGHDSHTRCSQHFHVTRAVWNVEVQLLGRYLDPTERDPHPELGKVPPPGAAFRSVAIPTLHPKYRYAKPRSLAVGVCAGEIGWSLNMTETWCLDVADKWLPALRVHSSYLCSAEGHRTDEVFFDVRPPVRLYAESALLWLLLTPFAVAQVILVLLVACDRCGLLAVSYEGPGALL